MVLLSRPGRALWLALLCGAWLLAAPPARAGSTITRDALSRFEELLELRLQDGRLSSDELTPAILVSAQPRYEPSQEWFAVEVVDLLQRTLGEGNLRLCEACMVPRVYVEPGNLTYSTGAIGLDEVSRLDDEHRGDAQPARAAVWVDETFAGVAVRIVDLHTARVIYAGNIDPNLVEMSNTARHYTLSEELENRARGDSVTQTFIDFALYPGQHLAVDWTEQWGETNNNLSGVTISVLGPVLGIGATHYRSLDLVHVLVGGKAVLSLPTAIVRSLGESDQDILDPLLTLVGVVRVPFGRSNYGFVLAATTSGHLGLGISLMNASLLPVIP